ncbi:MAG: glycosyltransferase family 2 protein [Armatimonadota bacterium]
MIDSLSIVYPMYNEMGNIRTAISEAIRVGSLITPIVEVIVVDDASTDGSGDLVDQLALEIPELRVVHHQVNRRLGGALKTGFAAASKEWILYMDSDLPIHMDDALQAVPLAENADIVIGWRKSRAESWRREVMSKIYNLMIRWMFNLHVTDVNFAFKLFKREFYDRILLTSEGSFIDAELLLEMQREGARFAELGLDYYPRVAGESTLASNSVVVKILEEMIRYRLEAYGKSTDHFGGERRRLWLERGDQSRDRVGVSTRNSS